MSELHDLGKFKAMRLIKKDLEVLKPKVDLLVKELSQYSHYIPIANILLTLTRESDNIRIHIEKVKKQLSSKGKV